MNMESLNKDNIVGKQLDLISQEDLSSISKKYNINENLLTKIEDKYFACNMPIEEYVNERAEIAKQNNMGDVNFLSKIDGKWFALFHGRQLDLEEWKKQVDLDKLYNSSDGEKENYWNK